MKTNLIIVGRSGVSAAGRADDGTALGARLARRSISSGDLRQTNGGKKKKKWEN